MPLTSHSTSGRSEAQVVVGTGNQPGVERGHRRETVAYSRAGLQQAPYEHAERSDKAPCCPLLPHANREGGNAKVPRPAPMSSAASVCLLGRAALLGYPSAAC